MYIVDLDGREIEWKPRGKEYLFNKNVSKLHAEVREILKEKFPTMRVLEEVSLPIRARKTLFLDFYIPLKNIGVEVHGQQHFAFSTLFHKTKADFMRQKKNDREKEEWCELNGITLIALRFDEQKYWRDQI